MLALSILFCVILITDLMFHISVYLVSIISKQIFPTSRDAERSFSVVFSYVLHYTRDTEKLLFV